MPASGGRAPVATRLEEGKIGEHFSAHFGCEVIDSIGSTEMLHVVLSNAPGRVRYGTAGWPVSGYAIELRGEDGRPVANGFRLREREAARR